MPKSTKTSSSTPTSARRRQRDNAVAKHVQRRSGTVPYAPQRPSQVAKRKNRTYSQNCMIVAIVLTASLMLNAAMVVAWIAG